MDESNAVLIGKKPVLNYVLACMILFKKGHQEIVLKARGHNISRAVDSVEVLKNQYLSNAQITDIQIGTVTLRNPNNDPRDISTIDIYVKA